MKCCECSSWTYPGIFGYPILALYGVYPRDRLMAIVSNISRAEKKSVIKNTLAYSFKMSLTQ